MMLANALAAAMKPALATGVIAATTAGGWFAYSNYTNDSPTAFQRVQDAGGRLLVSEFGVNADTIIAVDPNDVAGSREVIATIDHAAEYGILAALSPGGDAIAYTALPADTANPAPDVAAIAGIVDANGDTAVLANDIDLVVPPLWSPDAGSIVVRKNTPCEAAGLSCDEYPAGFFEVLLLGRDGTRSVITSWRSAAAFPVGFSPDGMTFYFTTLNAAGTDLYRVGREGTGEALVAHLSDQVARDWQLSPDGASLAFSAAESGAEPMVIARVVDLATGAITDALPSDTLEAGPASTGVARGEFNPAWQPDGDLTVASLNLDGGSAAVSVGADGREVETQTTETIDLPLGWSPDGEALAVRSVEGETPYEAGPSYVEVITGAGRARLSDSSDLTIVGWME